MAENRNWKERVRHVLAPKFIEKEINGESFNFYPITPGLLFKLKVIARPLVQALTHLFRDKSADVGKTLRGSTDLQTNERFEETIINAIDVKVLEHQASETDKAIDRLFTAFVNEKHALLLVAVIFDSCRDVFPRHPSDEDLQWWLDNTNPPVLFEFMKGVLEANVGIFGPLGERISDKIKKTIDERLENEIPEQPATAPTDDLPPTPPTPPAPPTVDPTSSTIPSETIPAPASPTAPNLAETLEGLGAVPSTP